MISKTLFFYIYLSVREHKWFNGLGGPSRRVPFKVGSWKTPHLVGKNMKNWIQKSFHASFACIDDVIDVY